VPALEIQKITPKELHERLKNKQNTFVLDVRAEDKFKDYHLDNSYNIPKSFIFELEGNDEKEIKALPKHKEIVVTCTTGNSAMKCAKILSERDYKVTVLDGGITAWKEYLRTL
jgi:rhodanese-related sulfurtransferase